MPSFPVRQPNGKFAVFSTVVDDFTMFNGTREEAFAQANRHVTDWFCEGSTPDDESEELWTECMMTRGIRWDEPGWVESTRLLCDIIEEANSKKESPNAEAD